MTERISGSATDIAYPFSYTDEMNPARLRLALLRMGIEPPAFETGCELGFGRGLSTNIHAAASSMQWYGTDGNPGHARAARDIAQAAGTGAKLFDESFADFCLRGDLPDFDYIALHGVWSWVPERDRLVIVDFIRRKLKPGGALYVSYNSLPGSSAMGPLRDLLFGHFAQMNTTEKDPGARIDAALEFLDSLAAAGPAYLRANPVAAQRIKSLKGQNRSYLAHEYFSRHWYPMSFVQMARYLSSPKLSFACSATGFDYVHAAALSAEQRQFLQQIPSPILRQTAWDLMVNREFRADYWVKGARKLDDERRIEALRAQRVILPFPSNEAGAITLSTVFGKAELPETSFRPILDVLADHQPKTLGEIEQALAGSEIDIRKLVDTALLLVSFNLLYPVQEQCVSEQARPRTDKLNAVLCASGLASAEFLSSPVTGGGVPVHPFSKLFLQAMGQGLSQPEELASFVQKAVSEQGARLVGKEGSADSETDVTAELARAAAHFKEKHLPLLRALQVA